jgi:hypothetical protein
MSIPSNILRTHPYNKIDPKIFAKLIFAWLAQIKNDRGLPPSGALFALQLIEHFNRDKGGAAWPSGRHIADQSGMSTANVVKLYHLFEQRGHLKVEWGKRGNGGHSNRCWMVIKPLPKARRKGHPDDLSKVTGVTFNKASVKGHKSGVKGHPNDQNHLRTTLVVSKMRESPPATAFSQDRTGRQNGAAGASDFAPLHDNIDPLDEGSSVNQSQDHNTGRPDDVVVSGFAELQAVWKRPWADNEIVNRTAYVNACRDANPGDILDGAKSWVAAADAPRFLPSLHKWLDSRCWEKVPPQKHSNNSRQKDLTAISLAHGNGELKMNTSMWGDGYEQQK